MQTMAEKRAARQSKEGLRYQEQRNEQSNKKFQEQRDSLMGNLMEGFERELRKNCPVSEHMELFGRRSFVISCPWKKKN